MNESKWIQLQRMIGLSPDVPLASQEGQIRYVRIADTDGALYVARGRVGGALEWGQLLTSNIAANLTATGADPTITNTPVGTYPGAGTTPTALSILGNDTAFRVSFTTGAAPGVGLLYHVAFAVPRATSNYDVWITSNTTAADPVQIHSTNRTTAGFDAICSAVPPGAGLAVGWAHLIVGY